MEIIIAILSSGAMGALIAAILKNIQTEKNNSLNYITEERKKWRSKIRKIGEKIQKCEYGDNSIKEYLWELSSNINAYGKSEKNNYEQDGHIWEIIEELKNAQDEESFEEDKEILLSYLSLLLKYDWERAKREIRGSKDKQKYVFAYIGAAILITIYYFGVLGLRDFSSFFCFVILYMVIIGESVRLVSDSLRQKAKIKSESQIKEICKRERGIDRKYFRVFVIILIGMLTVYLFIEISCSVQVINNIRYMEKEDGTEIYVGINRNFFSDVKNKMQEEYGIKVVFGENTKANSKALLEIEKYQSIRKTIGRMLMLHGAVPSTVLAIILLLPVIQLTEKRKDDINYRAEIKKVYLTFREDYIVDMRHAMFLVEEALGLEEEKSEKREILLGAAYKILGDVGQQLEIYMMKKEIKKPEDAEVYLELQKQIKVLEECKKLIKTAGKISMSENEIEKVIKDAIKMMENIEKSG